MLPKIGKKLVEMSILIHWFCFWPISSFRLPGLHQQPLLFLCALLCCGGESQIFSLEPFIYAFLCFIFVTCCVSSSRLSSRNGPSLALCRTTWLQFQMTCRWKKPTVISAPLFIYALCTLDICRLEAGDLQVCFCWLFRLMRTREGKVAARPEGKEVQLTSHHSGNDLWPFGIIQTVVQLQTWHNFL